MVSEEGKSPEMKQIQNKEYLSRILTELGEV